MNQIGGRVWFLDTVGTIYTSRVFIISIEWFNPSNLGDTYQTTEISGNLLAQARCETAGQTQILRPNQWFRGFVLTQLSSGSLQVTIK